MAQAIITKYHGPTDTKGSRISAEAAAGKIYMPYQHEFDIDKNHEAAAVILIKKFHWEPHARGGVAHGVLPNGDHVHVFIE
jgi:hypothetical protein